MNYRLDAHKDIFMLQPERPPFIPDWVIYVLMSAASVAPFMAIAVGASCPAH